MIKWRWAGTRQRLVAMEQSRRGCVGEGSVSWVTGQRTGFLAGAVALRCKFGGGWLHSHPSSEQQEPPEEGPAVRARGRERENGARKARTPEKKAGRPGCSAIPAPTPIRRNSRHCRPQHRERASGGDQAGGSTYGAGTQSPQVRPTGMQRPRGASREKISQAGSRRRHDPANNQCSRSPDGVELGSPRTGKYHETGYVRA